MSKKQAQAVADAELRALIIEQDARHAAVEAADRRERQRVMDQFRNEIARDRLEAQAQALEVAAAQEPEPVRAEPPRDAGRWLPAAQQPEPVQADPAAMDLNQYTAWRQADGQRMDGLGI